jgi:predicted AAA+ superfamily ATPase
MWSRLLESEVGSWHDLVRADEAPPADWRFECRRGGMPIPALELATGEDRTLWFDGYERTYLERDLQDLSAIDNLIDFRRLMRAACLRLGNLVNQAELGRDTVISRPTAHRYLNLLEASFQLVRLLPYSVNRAKRLVKSPKLYWTDSGLALHLGGGEPTGSHLENLVLCDLLAWRDSSIPRPEVLYWRTASGLEVDFVVEAKGRLLAVEVKAGSRIRARDLRGLEAFREEYAEDFLGALLLYDGEEVQWASDRILAAPWHRVV